VLSALLRYFFELSSNISGNLLRYLIYLLLSTSANVLNAFPDTSTCVNYHSVRIISQVLLLRVPTGPKKSWI